MGIIRLDHFTIRTKLWLETADFFERVIGLTPGPRPEFSFPGYWMYAGKDPLLHIASVSEDQKNLEEYLGENMGDFGSGSIDHISLRCDELQQFQDKLQSMRVNFRERVIPQIREHQLFIEDPNGITIELIFDWTPDNLIVGSVMAPVDIGQVKK